MFGNPLGIILLRWNLKLKKDEFKNVLPNPVEGK